MMDTPFNFPLDPFQIAAIQGIQKDENVLVTAKTGSGKTLVGEYQIWRSLNKRKRVFYTTPIKSLSNQKFHDLKKIYGDRVGIMTGDIKFCPQADVVIMTTEILRNLLYKQGTVTEKIGISAELSLHDLDAVVFDEVHYINDPGRGSVWEECLVLLPPEVNLVLLSATLDSPEPFVEWLKSIKQKQCHLISTEYRVVPLIHMTEDGEVIMDAKDTFHFETYKSWVRKYYNQQDELRKHKEKVKSREEGHVIEKTVRIGSFLDRMNKLILKMDKPALFFVFSRKLCEEYASKVSADLLTSSETADVKHIVKFHLHKFENLQKIEGFHRLNSLLEKGIAFHHSGMLPILKEIVEVLFDKGFIKILFATETFAVGINMPTKTVVFTSYRKYDENMRMLRTSEYIQMAGRAGRRGKDDKGIVIYLPNREPEEPQLIKEMMTGKKARVESQMKFDYSYILATVGSGKSVQDNTYWMKQNVAELDILQETQQDLEEQLSAFDEIVMRVCDIRSEIQEHIRNCVNSEKRKYQQELSKWDNSHVGPKWEKAKKEYVQYNLIKEKQLQLIREIKHTQKYLEDIETRKSFLFKHQYLNDDGLTQKGLLASEVHEAHPLLIAELYVHKWVQHEIAANIVKTLSCFLEEPTTEEHIPVTHHIQTIRNYAVGMAKNELLQSNPEYWKVTDYWHDVVGDWLEGNDFVCEKYGIEHGNFVRAILKLANIVREWVSMATIQQDTEMVEKLNGMEQILVRGFVIPDSLYLRI